MHISLNLRRLVPGQKSTPKERNSEFLVPNVCQPSFLNEKLKDRKPNLHMIKPVNSSEKGGMNKLKTAIMRKDQSK